MTDWRPLAKTLAAELVDENALTDPEWRAAIENVPRHVFLPSHPMDAAYANDALIIQHRPTAIPGGTAMDLPTSSASQPSIVAVMLERLNIQPGSRVLEIGTGTGYNAALLSHRLGSTHVHSIDIDSALVDSAGAALRSLGLEPTLATGDGYRGSPAGAPYDRIIATCAVSHVPPEWIRQLAGGGRIVAPLFGDGCGLMVLDKIAADEVVGRFDTNPAGFMPLRDQITNPLAPGHSLGSGRHGMAHYGITDVGPRQIADASPDLLLFLQFHLPGLRVGSTERDEGPVVVASTPTSHADVPLNTSADGTWPTIQRGPQRLWDTIEHAIHLWHALQHPTRQRFGITALDDTSRQYVWLDDPDGPYAWPMPL